MLPMVPFLSLSLARVFLSFEFLFSSDVLAPMLHGRAEDRDNPTLACTLTQAAMRISLQSWGAIRWQRR